MSAEFYGFKTGKNVQIGRFNYECWLLNHTPVKGKKHLISYKEYKDLLIDANYLYTLLNILQSRSYKIDQMGNFYKDIEHVLKHFDKKYRVGK